MESMREVTEQEFHKITRSPTPQRLATIASQRAHGYEVVFLVIDRNNYAQILVNQKVTENEAGYMCLTSFQKKRCEYLT